MDKFHSLGLLLIISSFGSWYSFQLVERRAISYLNNEYQSRWGADSVVLSTCPKAIVFVKTGMESPLWLNIANQHQLSRIPSVAYCVERNNALHHRQIAIDMAIILVSDERALGAF